TPVDQGPIVRAQPAERSTVSEARVKWPPGMPVPVTPGSAGPSRAPGAARSPAPARTSAEAPAVAYGASRPAIGIAASCSSPPDAGGASGRRMQEALAAHGPHISSKPPAGTKHRPAKI